MKQKAKGRKGKEKWKGMTGKGKLRGKVIGRGRNGKEQKKVKIEKGNDTERKSGKTFPDISDDEMS